MEILAAFSDPILLGSIFAGLIMFGLAFYFGQYRSESAARAEIRSRLEIDGRTPSANNVVAKNVAKKLANKTNKFYAQTDPKNLKKMQLQLVQAGYLQKYAVGYFLAIRIFMGLAGILIGLLIALVLYPELSMANKCIIILLLIVKGYFIPNILLNKKITKRKDINRQGFPDVLDLMIVAAEAGLTTEASIERIATELEKTYPVLSEQLHIVSVEVRAGKPLDEALRAFGDRVGLEEVQGFATMIQQSKELGTSVSDALRVFADEMRHKRMMIAEEKAYALPAKLSIPVTLFILPIVIGVAVIPTIVRMNM